MSIPLPDLLRQHRFQLSDNGVVKLKPRLALASWGFLASRPRLYRWVMNLITRVLHWAARGRGRLQKVPFAGGWSQSRDLPAPQGETFIAAWQRQQAKRNADND
jgi:L-lactate dehydrogenase complex protein LldF